MRVAMVHFKVGFGEGGTETVIKNLSGKLAQRGHDVHILTNKGEIKFDNGVKVTYLPYIRIPFSKTLDYYSLMFSFSFFAMLKILFSSYDVVHCHFYVDAFLPLLAAKLKGVPTVYSLHGMLDKEGEIAELASKVSVISKNEEKYWKSRGLKPETIYIGVDPERVKRNGEIREKLRKEFGIKKNDFVVIAVSRPADVKGPEILYDVITKADPEIKFILVGVGQEKMFAGMKLKNVYPFGLVPHEKVVEFYSAADASLVISKIESISLVMIESMSAQLPLIIAAGTAIDKSVTEGSSIMVNLEPNKVLDALNKLYKNRKMASMMGRKGREIVNKKFSWERVADRYEAIYKELKK